mgnify:CR=1 FL=1
MLHDQLGAADGDVLVHAIISAEDDTFFEHSGLRPLRILVTLAKDVIHQRGTLKLYHYHPQADEVGFPFKQCAMNVAVAELVQRFDTGE